MEFLHKEIIALGNELHGDTIISTRSMYACT